MDISKSELFELVATHAEGWQVAVDDAWDCLNEDDKLRIQVLAQGTYTAP